MTKYRLTALGDTDFEEMVQSLLKRVIGAGTITFGAGKDGAREATFEGRAPYPSTVDQWDGKWIFQVKFHDTDLVNISRARTKVKEEVDDELDKIVNKYKYGIQNYILITNVTLTGVHDTGTIDKIENEVFPKYRNAIPHLAVWGAKEVCAFLDIYPEVRQPYVNLLVIGDLIAELLTQSEKTRTERAATIEMYLRTAITREANAQLDQAGDVSEDKIPLQEVFFDLDAFIEFATRDAMEWHRARLRSKSRLPVFGHNVRLPMVRYLVEEDAPKRIVIVGGPGEGKSTIGQYLAQLHRAALLGQAEDIAISDDYVPSVPRIPFRVVLKDFAQWLADRAGETGEPDSLDTYVVEQIVRLSTRDFSEKDLHEILRTDPALLVLDGLDEVTDPVLRRRLVMRLLEFLDRAQNTLRADLQVVAATRPTTYGEQFDPKTFFHFRLHKLLDSQVRDYVSRWTVAQVLEEDKSSRLVATIEECLKDSQIKLLMTTPLQVTILILIISGGGTPPRQREALFNEYLEVIYKREKAKGLDIIKTEKELLIGLHKFIGYILHEEATRASASAAKLPRSSYERIVVEYLRGYDPYSDVARIDQERKAITEDAGERLVLIVESPADFFGFELRSIQEFFAACYLSDSSSDTGQRFRRLQVIAHLPHWRNVALFFAGRVGRSVPGEAAYVVEVCKEIDRDGPDVFAHRGAEVALELAAERALGPSRVLQRSLLEHGLSVFDGVLSPDALRTAIELVRRLPEDDVTDHVLPTLSQRLPLMGTPAVANACYLLGLIAPNCELFAANLRRLVAERGPLAAGDVLTVLTYPDVDGTLRSDVVKELLVAGVAPHLVGEILASSQWPTLCSVAAEIDASDLDPVVKRVFATEVAETVGNQATRVPHEGPASWPEGESFRDLLVCVRIGGMFPELRSYSDFSSVLRTSEVRQKFAEGLPSAIRAGSLSADVLPEDTLWIGWLMHLTLGDVSPETVERFAEWLPTWNLTPRSVASWRYLSYHIMPLGDLVSRDHVPDLHGLGDALAGYLGSGGDAAWADVVERVAGIIGGRTDQNARRLAYLGPGALPPEAATPILKAISELLPSIIVPVALDWLMAETRPRGARLNGPEVDRLMRWHVEQPADSIWKCGSYVARAALQAAATRQVLSPTFAEFVTLVHSHTLAMMVVNVAERDCVDAELEFLLGQPQFRAFDSGRMNVYVSQSKRRQVLLRLLGIADGAGSDVRKAAHAVVRGICLTSDGDDDSPRRAIRSTELDRIHNSLLLSPDPSEHVTGISLYVFRPPRTESDWRQLGELLESATDDETGEYWSWVLSGSADLSNAAGRWVTFLTDVLGRGQSGRELSVVLMDVLRKMLPRESQSLSAFEKELSLPRAYV